MSNNSFLTLDIAVISHNSNIEINIDSDVHNIYLEEIPITLTDFQELFYPDKRNFIIDEIICKNENNLIYTSFNPDLRKTDKGVPLNLFSNIISFYENDLNTSRNAFTPDSLICLTKEINQIQNISDIQSNCIDNSIDWETLIDIISNHYKQIINTDNSNIIKNAYSFNKKKLYSNFIVNVVFRSPNTLIKPIIMKIIYKVIFPDNFFN